MTGTIGSICSGAGALELGLCAALGWDPTASTRWHAEVDAGAVSVLEKRWPGVPNIGDIKSVDWEIVKEITVPVPRKDEQARAMYEAYQSGLSLTDVGLRFGVTRQTVWKYFARRGWPMRPLPLNKATVEFAGRRFTERHNGYYAETTGKREWLHRVVWEAHHGPIPEDHDIHHLDHDKSNNDVSNLECVTHAEHTRIYGLWRASPDEEVVPTDSPAVDWLTAGYP